VTRSFFSMSPEGPSLGYVQSGQGPVATFQHGLGADAAQPREVFPDDVGHSLLTLECRGHAQSELGPPEEVSIPTFVDDLARLLDRLALPRCVIGGISLGAAVALRFAVVHPECVAALILARPAWVTASAPANLAIFQEIAGLLTEHGAQEGKARFQQSQSLAAIGSISPDNAVSLLGQFDAPGPLTRAILLHRISNGGPAVSEEELSALRIPVLVLGNEMDAIHPVAYAKTLATIIPAARLIEITPKSLSRARYVADFRAAVAGFMMERAQ